MDETNQLEKKLLAMNEALVLGSMRQHELTEAAEKLNAQLRAEITERKLAERKLSVSEVRYRRLFEAATVGVLVLDARTRKVTDANPFITKLLGRSHRRLIGRELSEIGLLRNAALCRKMFRSLERKREVRYENLPIESRGRDRVVAVVANLYQENGHAVVQCNVRDITERRQAEEMLRRNEALFSALVAQVPVGVCVVDAQLRLQQINPTARLAFKKVRPLMGRNISEILRVLWPKRIADRVSRQFSHTLKTGAVFQSLDFAERRRDIGVKEFYELQIQRVTLPAGEFGVVCFLNNITERKRAEETRRRVDVLTASNQQLRQEIIRRHRVELALTKSERQSRRLLEQARQMQEKLRRLSRQLLTAQEQERKRISRELHDVIAQTLTGIHVRLAALKAAANVNTRELEQIIARTQSEVEESVQVVHRFARELRPTVLDDVGLVPALNSLMKTFGQSSGFQIKLTASPEIDEVNGDKRTVLFRVVQEALNNAGRHAQASRVEVNIQKLEDTVCLTIKDDGKGFQATRVLHVRRSKRLGFLGMRERLEMVGGNLSIRSAPGRGTTVLACIPLTTIRRGGTLDE